MILFHYVFDKVHELSDAGLDIAQYNFNQQIYNPFLKKLLSIYINDIIGCQMQKYKTMKQNKAAILPISKQSSFLIIFFLMDTGRPLSCASESIHNNLLNVDHASNYIVAVPTPIKQLITT